MARWIGDLDMSPLVILLFFILFYLVLGAVMDSFAVMVITVPVVTPIIVDLGFDIYFWGVLMLIIVELGLITPPFGINLFVIKSLQPKLPLAQIMRGVLPFIAADVIKITILIAFPALVLLAAIDDAVRKEPDGALGLRLARLSHILKPGL